ncbi:hypothetical protein FNV43_RR22470 [Rhamnella rubrinervis]|uniref:Alpha/beta hydrolase fold-3 domain-containing protein n=1 Tax=Rhamnella rubrinervis TaxID=2594499 RepID=A0A8K0DRM5_9ROSA|nr:hypothetical protein FNV43_RR22470 [Rhamnella rubrinervis]
MDTKISTLSDEVAHDYSPYLKIYKDGRVERIAGIDSVPPSLDPRTGVESKDVVISPEKDVSARIFIPKTTTTSTVQKLPLLVYFHGGAFCIETPFSRSYHNFLNELVAEANVVAVSVHYRRAPEHPLPIAYEDSWESIKWAVSHFEGKGPEEWLNSNVDYNKVFFGGDSAGANIAHHMALRVSSEGLGGPKIVGLALIHPYFWGSEPIGSEETRVERRVMAEAIWRFACPTTSGSDDPLINPAKDPNLGKLSGDRVLVCVAEKDGLKDRGWYYQELLEKSGWRGTVEVDEIKEEDHVFHMLKPTCDNALLLIKKVASFINQA